MIAVIHSCSQTFCHPSQIKDTFLHDKWVDGSRFNTTCYMLIYNQIFSPKKNWGFPHKKNFPIFFWLLFTLILCNFSVRTMDNGYLDKAKNQRSGQWLAVASLSRILFSKQIFHNLTMIYHLSREAKIFGLFNHESRLNF